MSLNSREADPGQSLVIARVVTRLWHVLAAVAPRVLQIAIVAVGISTLLFLFLRLSGDPVALMLPPDATAEEVERLRESLGLGEPIHVQYILFLSGLLRLDFGDSLVFRSPALGVATSLLPATLQLTAAAIVVSTVAGFALGIAGAASRSRIVRVAASVPVVLGQSMPSFWIGILLIQFVAVDLGWLPSFGSGTAPHMVLPTLALAASPMAKLARVVRANMSEQLGQDYVRTARAKGSPASRVVRVHVLRNVLVPVVTVLSVDVSLLLGGAVVVESVFAWPGVGRQLVRAVLGRDYPLVQAIVFLIAVLVVVLNMTMEAIYRRVDPRIGTSER